MKMIFQSWIVDTGDLIEDKAGISPFTSGGRSGRGEAACSSRSQMRLEPS